MRIATVIKHCLMHRSSHFMLELLPYLKEHFEVHIFTGEWEKSNERKIHFHKIPIVSPFFYIQEIFFTLISTFVMKFNSFDLTFAQATRYFSPDISFMEFCYKGWAEYKRKMGMRLNIQDVLSPLIEEYNLGKCKRVVATSNGLKKEIMKFYKIASGKITVIPNGVNIEKFKPDKKKRVQLRKLLKIGANDFVLLFVGRNLKRKGLKYVIGALHMIDDKKIKLVVCGGDDAEHRDLVHQSGEDERVIFVSDVKNIEDYFAMADLFVFPTFYEGFSFATLQAASSGLPIIATIANGTDDLIKNGENGYLLKTRTAEEISQKIKTLLNRPSLRKSMGKNARKTAVERFSWDVVAKKLIETFEETISTKRGL